MHVVTQFPAAGLLSMTLASCSRTLLLSQSNITWYLWSDDNDDTEDSDARKLARGLALKMAICHRLCG